MRNKKKDEHIGETFPGFPSRPVTNYWPYPKALNGWWSILSGSEQKALDYILRHTWGYKKTADQISLSQFKNGIVKRDGTVLDRGTGIKDDRTLRKALNGLVGKKFVIRVYQNGMEPIYELNIDPLQELPLPAEYDSGPKAKTATPPSSQNMSPTIKDISIKNNNNIADTQIKDKKTYKEEIVLVITYLSHKLGIQFPNYGKQAKYAKNMLEANYSVEDICWAVDKLREDQWWRERSFDMKNVADEIAKLMTRTFKAKEG